MQLFEGYFVGELVVQLQVLDGDVLFEQQCEYYCYYWLEQEEWVLVLFGEDVQQVVVDVVVKFVYVGIGVVVEVVGFVLVVGGVDDVLFVGVVLQLWIIYLVVLVVDDVVCQFYVFQDFGQCQQYYVGDLCWNQYVVYEGVQEQQGVVGYVGLVYFGYYVVDVVCIGSVQCCQLVCVQCVEFSVERLQFGGGEYVVVDG